MNLLANPNTNLRTSATDQPSRFESQTQERLRNSGYRALRRVSCLSRDGVLVLHGCVPSYYLKQVAQEIAAGAEGVRQVINQIEVFRSQAPGTAGRSG
jgi:osmotically-inducible protein OsmY